MKMSYGKRAGSVLLAAILGVSGLSNAFVFAAYAEEGETEIVTEAETELETEVEETEAVPLELVVGEETVLVTNNTGLDLVSLEFGTPAGDVEEETEIETDEDTEAQDAASEGTDCLIVTEADGTEHIFEEVDLSDLTDLQLKEMIGFVFLVGTNADGDEKYFYETAEDVTLDESVVMYTVGMVNIREEPDGSSTLLGTADRGSEVEVLGGTSKWFFVTQGEITGYVAARYLTTAEEEAAAAVEAEATAQAAAAAQAAAVAAAQAAAAAASSGSSSSSGSTSSAGSSSSGTTSEKTEVSREAVYDCDGSGHGYYIVTYSDGSTEYIDF